MAGITERDFGALHGLLDVDHIDDSGPGMPWRLWRTCRSSSTLTM